MEHRAGPAGQQIPISSNFFFLMCPSNGWLCLEKKIRAFLVAHMVKILPAMQETRFNPWVGKIPWRRA